MNKRLVFLAFFGAIIVTILIYIDTTSKNSAIENNVLKYNQQELATILQMNQKLVEEKIEDILDPTTLAIMKAASSTKDEDQLSKLRNQLYEHFDMFYQKETARGNVRQLHFHLPGTISFLRFHRPNKYGDDLTSIRESINIVNRTHEHANGFEEGRIFNGFRHVEPIMEDGKFYGTVEFSYSFHTIVENLSMVYNNNHYYFILKKRVVNNKVFHDERQNYETSTLSSLYYHDKNVQQAPNAIRINKRLFGSVDHQLLEGDSFTKYLRCETTDCIVSFIPIKNFKDQTVAYIITYNKDSQISTNAKYAFTLAILILLIGVIVFVYYYKQQLVIEQSKDEIVNQMLNTNTKMVILTDGDSLVMANRAFYSFVGYEDYQAFIKEHHSTSEFFLKHENFFSTEQYEPGMGWAEYMLMMPEDMRVVSMIGPNEVPYAFMLSIEKFSFKSAKYIISFNDITSLMIEKDRLFLEANQDKLTAIYNRNFLMDRLETLLKTPSHADSSLIMFDIDDFKKINDTYGHDIGDEVLVGVSHHVSTFLRDEDIFARWGGEEFLIIAHGLEDGAMNIAEKLREIIEHIEFSHNIGVTCSFGVTQIHPHDEFKPLLKRVDQALYEAKHSGKNCVCRS
jgi:diguanylate cyclase (GGDEF)-like protein